MINKKISTLLLLFTIIIFNGCAEDEEVVFSDAEKNIIAALTIFSGYLPYMLKDTEEGSYNSETESTGIPIISGTVVVNEGSSKFTFTKCELDFNSDGLSDVLVNGGFVFDNMFDINTFLLTDLSISSTKGQESGIVNGAHLISSTEWDANIKVSIVNRNDCDATLVVTMIPNGSGGYEPGIVNTATLEGEDISQEITCFLNNM